jgi:ferredoxin
MFEAGIEGLWTPILIARIGYCEHSCVLCGQVCPTGAIQKITEKEKLGQGVPPVKIGTAFYDHGRCLPWSMQTPCIVCEEFCPTSPKAIWVEEVDAEVRDEKPGPNGAQPPMKMPGAGSAGGLHHERRRDALQDQRNLAREHQLQPEKLGRPLSSLPSH